MAKDYKEKITMRFNISQLDRIIVALLNNGSNKKFAHNISRLFDIFIEESYKNDWDKELRVYLVKKISSIIIDKSIVEKDSILTFLDLSGKYENDTTEIMNKLFDVPIDEKELENLDKLISEQLKFSIIGKDSTQLSDFLTNFQTENYEDFSAFMQDFAEHVDGLSKKLRGATESIEDAKQDVSLGSDSFINVLSKIIKEDRNPSAKVKTGIRMLNEAFNGGYEKSRVYLALGLAKG